MVLLCKHTRRIKALSSDSSLGAEKSDSTAKLVPVLVLLGKISYNKRYIYRVIRTRK